MPLNAIDKGYQTLAEVAYDRISAAMLSGEFPPGTRLVMDTIAEQLDISRTPVRDAFGRLEREGVIVPTGRRGYVIREASPQEIENLYQAREAIEGYAARRVAELGEDAIAIVAKVLDQHAQIDNSDPAAAYHGNRAVHRAFVEALDNPILLEAFDAVWTRAMAQQGFAYFVHHATPRPSLRDEHEPLLAAVRQSPEQAHAAMIEHIRHGLAGNLRNS